MFLQINFNVDPEIQSDIAYYKMASEDVIELGSSDDEAEPATKKVTINSSLLYMLL